MPTFSIQTFGCQMNYSDSERIISFLESYQFNFINNIHKADLIIFNTCGVRQMAEDRIYGQINNLKQQHKKLLIVVTGCLAYRQDVQKRLKNQVDLFFNIKDFNKLEKWIHKTFSLKEKSFLDFFSSKKYPTAHKISYLSLTPKYSNFFQAYVPIMTGCNNFCTYCVVPYARGREYSRPAKEIIQEIKKLLAKNYKEIFLLGQNVNSYYDKKQKINFAQLLKKINSLPGNFWIRFLTSHPKDMSDELIKVITSSQKICEYVHLPLQAGDNEVLKKMNRKYSPQHYLKTIQKIKNSFKKNKPHSPFAITTDIIVGFPDETRNQFQKTKEIMKKVNYDMTYISRYSPRPGTVAWNFPDNITLEEKKKREKEIEKILEKTSLKNNQKYLNKKVTILIDKKRGESFYGKTRTLKNVKVISKNKKYSVGNFYTVKITQANIWNLEGEIIE